MNVTISKAESADEYMLEREDGETLITADLVLLRTTKKKWEELEYEPRTVTQALALLGAHINALRPENNPSKEQSRAARLAAKKVNKLCKKLSQK